MIQYPGALSLRAINHSDIPILTHWFELEHVKSQFGEAEIWLNEIGENLDSEWVEHYLALEGEVPVGFGQIYKVSGAPPGPWSEAPGCSAGIDYLIGNRDYLGRGYGKQLVALLVENIRQAGLFDFVVADPDPGNEASVAVLRNAGFLLLDTGLYCLGLSKSVVEVSRGNSADI